MRRWVGVIGLGVLLGVVGVVGTVPGLALGLIAGLAGVLVLPRGTRIQAGGVILATAALTAAALVGRVVFLNATDPGTTMAPGTLEFFVLVLALAVVGVGVAAWGSRRA